MLNTYDFEIQHNFSLGSWNSVVWGAGNRINQYGITNRIAATSSLLFIPDARTLDLADIFAEDHIRLADTLQLVAGLKLEDDPFSGVTPMPSVRLSWKPDSDTLLWAAVSRVIRAPTPFDTDVAEKLGTITFLAGDPNFLPEQVTAFELGYRGQISSRLSVSVSAFQNVYDDLKDIEKGTVTVLRWGNGIEGDVHGVFETWGTFQRRRLVAASRLVSMFSMTTLKFSSPTSSRVDRRVTRRLRRSPSPGVPALNHHFARRPVF